MGGCVEYAGFGMPGDCGGDDYFGSSCHDRAGAENPGDVCGGDDWNLDFCMRVTWILTGDFFYTKIFQK